MTDDTSHERPGSLLVVGTGIQASGQLTIEARNAIQQADKLLYLVVEPVAATYLEGLNSNAESLADLYAEDSDRAVTYLSMAERILHHVRLGLDVCVAFYGHPCVFVLPSRIAVERARDEGFSARILPGISAEDCLFADLGLDPSTAGCQSYEATDFLVFRRRFNTTSPLVLWQVGIVGDLGFRPGGYGTQGLQVLTEYLLEQYGRTHRVVIYEASLYPIFPPRIEMVALAELPFARPTPISTLYVPPADVAEMDGEMLHRLGLRAEQIMQLQLGKDLRHIVVESRL